jgi:hypothetical protein
VGKFGVKFYWESYPGTWRRKDLRQEALDSLDASLNKKRAKSQLSGYALQYQTTGLSLEAQDCGLRLKYYSLIG